MVVMLGVEGVEGVVGAVGVTIVGVMGIVGTTTGVLDLQTEGCPEQVHPV